MKKVNVGIIGLGTIGSGVYKIIAERRTEIKKAYNLDISITKCCDISEVSRKKLRIPKSMFTKNYRDITNSNDIDVVIELIGGTKIAHTISKEALRNNKHLITANKALLAEHGKKLRELAKRKSKNIGYEASVGGGIPIISSILDSILINKISSFKGIFNGTCNYILSLMSRGIDFKEALKMAQDQGFAEADPTLDINGKDSAHKVAVLSQTCFGINLKLSQIFTQGIQDITSYDLNVANNLGYKIKLLGISKIIKQKIDVRVHPTLVRNNNPLANVENEFNAILLDSKNLGPFMGYGYGAGMLPTATAIISDIIRTTNKELYPPDLKSKASFRPIKFEEIKSKFYIRIELEDKPGNLGATTTILGKFKINIDEIIQSQSKIKSKSAPVVILTKNTEYIMVDRALKKISQAKLSKNKALVIPIEDFN